MMKQLFLVLASPILLPLFLLVLTFEYIFLQHDERVQEHSRLREYLDQIANVTLLLLTLPFLLITTTIGLCGMILRELFPAQVSQSSVQHVVGVAEWIQKSMFWIATVPVMAVPTIIALLLSSITWDPLFGLVQRFWLRLNARLYRPLDPQTTSVRILELQPGSAGQAMKCKLLEASVSEDEFETLSYVWGGHLTLRRAITIDGAGTFWATETVYRALQQLRLPDQPRRIWVDQICINQSDNDEKSDQVQNKMRLVYRNAKQVIVWLSNGSHTQLPDAFSDAKRKVRDVEVEDIGREAPDASPVKPIYKDAWDRVLSHKWWSRVWIIQEVALNDTVVVRCGGEEVKWKDFAYFVLNFAEDAGIQTPAKVEKLITFVNNRQQDPTGTTQQSAELVSLVNEFSENSASNPRDKIYAFLGLTDKYGLLEPGVVSPPFKGADYSRDHYAVFADFTAHCILRYKTLAFLALAERDHAGLHSWACNFAYSGAQVEKRNLIWGWGLKPTLLSQVAGYSACAGRPAHCRKYDPDSMIITLTGWRIDSVEASSVVAKTRSLVEPLTVWEEFVHSHLRNQTHAREQFLRTITGDAWTGDFPSSWKDCFSEGENASQSDCVYYNMSEIPVPVKFYWWVVVACQGRRFFISSKGNFGLGPAKMLPGDQVCVLEGSDVPCLLRPVPKMSDFWEDESTTSEELIFKRPNLFRGQVILLGHMYRDGVNLQARIDGGGIRPREIQLQ